MKLYTTNLSTSKDFTNNFKEFFILPDNITEVSAKKMLRSIKSKSWGNWERLPREVVEIKHLTQEDIEKLKALHIKFKFISTSNDLGVDQIFIFSPFADHDCMYEMIQNFDEEIDAGFRARLGAGFTNFTKCYGRSETLNLDSREEFDTALLKRVLL